MVGKTFFYLSIYLYGDTIVALQFGRCLMFSKMSICRKDDDWKLSRGVYIFVIIGLLLLLGAISALIVVVQPWTVSAILFIVLNLISLTCVLIFPPPLSLFNFLADPLSHYYR